MSQRTLAKLWGALMAAVALATACVGATGTAIAVGATAVLTAGVAWLATGLQRREAARLQQRREAALAHTVHELRTPLASIAMALEMAREGYLEDPNDLAGCLDQAALAARHLGFLVDDVLDSAAAAAGQLRLQLRHHRVSELFAAAKDVLGVQAENRGLQLRFLAPDPALQVHTDDRRFLQVVFNLVGNALKFSAPGDCVTVDAVRMGNRIRFAVHDHGPGVPQHVRPRLFQPFGTVPESGGDGPSTGLGLHVCAVLVKQLQGAIGYQPGTMRGSVFWFELPVAHADPSQTPLAAPARAALHATDPVR